jgi:hypothetical protein
LQNNATFGRVRFEIRKLLKIEPILINRQTISMIVVDQHIKKHRDITDDIIIDLVRMLSGTESDPISKQNEFQYFVSLLVCQNKKYRLVWLLERGKMYIGVITAYRDRRTK